LEKVMHNYQGQSVSFHCEDPQILKKHEGEPSHELRRPREAEIFAIKFAIELIKKYKLHGKICHLSTREGLELVRKAKQEGVSLTCEVTPHHLYFDHSAALQMNPPLRDREDQQALISGLKKGTIDYLATDHAPHSIEERDKSISGLPHLDTYGNLATWLMAEHAFTPRDIARVCAFNPGRFINEFCEDKFGKIVAGYVGSLTIINPSEPITIDRKDLKTKAGWSPFEGITFPGRVTHTIVRGKIYEN
jgi:dihydroorotase